MHAVLRAVPLALGLVFAAELRAQTAPVPAIFAPHVGKDAPAFDLRATWPASPSIVSDRVRSLVQAASVKVLAEAKAFEVIDVAHVNSLSVDVASGATRMRPMIVKARSMQDSDLRPPTLRLLHFAPLGGDKHRRIAGGVTAPLYQTMLGSKELQVDFNIANGAGRGVDHGRDFTRAEIAFTLKF
jgi:hypothetical protein